MTLQRAFLAAGLLTGGLVAIAVRRRQSAAPQSQAQDFQRFSYRSTWSVLSASSLLSVGSAASVLSVGSFASVLSIGSSNSVLSIGSDGGFLSVGRSRSRPERSHHLILLCQIRPRGIVPIA